MKDSSYVHNQINQAKPHIKAAHGFSSLNNSKGENMSQIYTERENSAPEANRLDDTLTSSQQDRTKIITIIFGTTILLFALTVVFMLSHFSQQINQLSHSNQFLANQLDLLTIKSDFKLKELFQLQITAIKQNILDGTVKNTEIVNSIKMISNTLYYNNTKNYHIKPSWPGNNFTDFLSSKDNKDNREFLANTQYGIQIYVDPRDNHISRYVAENGVSYPQLCTLLGNLVPEGGVFLNIGSHVGFESIMMAKTMGPKSQIFIIEPNPTNVALIKKTIKHNHIQNQFTIFQMGVSNKPSKSYLNVKYSNTGASRVTSSPTDADETVPITVDRADQIIPKDVVVDFALIDVEFMERQALEGLRGIVQRSPNLTIYIEFIAVQYIKGEGELLVPVMDFFRAKGYRFYTYHPPKETGTFALGTFQQHLHPETGIDSNDLLLVPPGRQLVDGAGSQWKN